MYLKYDFESFLNQIEWSICLLARFIYFVNLLNGFWVLFECDVRQWNHALYDGENIGGSDARIFLDLYTSTHGKSIWIRILATENFFLFVFCFLGRKIFCCVSEWNGCAWNIWTWKFWFRDTKSMSHAIVWELLEVGKWL